nr:translesion error-prone DNA polymerase V autoproteolytic subunit [Methylobacterium sp. OTU13CASTA1]
MSTTSSRGGARPNAGRRKSEPTKVVRLPVEIADLARRIAARGGTSGGIAAFLKVDGNSTAEVPYVTASVACGFPSPAEDSLESPLDFNELVGARLPSVFAVRVAGESMLGAGLYPGDVAVVDKAKTPTHGCIVVACLNGEFTMKRFLKKRGRIILHPENPAFPDIEVPDEAEFEVWGVVTHSFRRY